MTRDELDRLREGWDFEAKRAGGRDGRGAVPASLWETYSAMANTEGGLILLGAKERADGSLEFTGIADVEKLERDLWNTLENPQKVSANVLRRQDVERLEVEGRTLLLLRVPKAPRAARPVFLDGAWEKGTYLRVHEGDRRAAPDVARRMLADSVLDRDAGTVDEYTLADLNKASVRRYREFFATRRPDHPFLANDDQAFLIAIGAARQPRGHGTARPTWAGLWMLGEELAIREALPPWHLSYKELPLDPEDQRRWVDRVHPDGTWNANVFEFYLRVIVKLHEGLKTPFSTAQGQFRVDETPVHDAVREALVNALTHADYQGTTGVRAIKRRAGFEFINPGLLLVTPEQVWRGGVSEPRNPALHRLFGLLRLGEREGSGGPVMRRVWRAQHWRAPRIWSDVEHGETHLQLPLESLLPEWAVAALVERHGSAFTRQDELGRTILVTAEVEGRLDHARVRELSEAHSRDITLKLQELMRHGLLESAGKTRDMTYSPAGRDAERPLTSQTALSFPQSA
ncbi:MAG: putative DNA binding domain-containing protein, partial [Myxococcales bacterium]|nr:putative DNA binding domain-containing protein [Myxococcales bacterium]